MQIMTTKSIRSILIWYYPALAENFEYKNRELQSKKTPLRPGVHFRAPAQNDDIIVSYYIDVVGKKIGASG